MSEKQKRSISELMQDHDLITAAINRGVQRAVLRSARLGNPVATTENGKVVWVPPEEILAIASEWEQEENERTSKKEANGQQTSS
jgi:hypothetical protein